MFSQSSTGSWAELQLPCCPSKKGELPENMLQNLLHNLPPQTVQFRNSGEMRIQPTGSQVLTLPNFKVRHIKCAGEERFFSHHRIYLEGGPLRNET